MATDAVNKVIAKESDAEARLSSAKESAIFESEQLVENAHKEADRILSEARLREAEILSTAEAYANDVYAKAEADSAKTCAALKEKNSALKDTAVSTVSKILF